MIFLTLTGLLAIGGMVISMAQDGQRSPAPTDSNFLAGPTLAAMIGGSLNSTMFHHYYMFDEKKREVVDIVNGGDSSCAFYVSVLLQSVRLCDGVYPHMDHLMDALKRCGWRELKPEEPDTSIMVVVWGTDYGNRHLGFAFKGSEMAISHSSFEGAPRRHTRTLRDGRTIARRWVHPQLTNLDEQLRLHGVI